MYIYIYIIWCMRYHRDNIPPPPRGEGGWVLIMKYPEPWPWRRGRGVGTLDYYIQITVIIYYLMHNIYIYIYTHQRMCCHKFTNQSSNHAAAKVLFVYHQREVLHKSAPHVAWRLRTSATTSHERWVSWAARWGSKFYFGGAEIGVLGRLNFQNGDSTFGRRKIRLKLRYLMDMFIEILLY